MTTNFLIKIAEIILPKWVHKRLVDDWNIDGFKKYFHNTGWLFVSRMVSFITSFFTVIFVARYLGPENLGKISYAQSLVMIFSMFASLGIDHIVYRDLVAKPEKENGILGTAIVTKFIFGLLTFFVTITISISLNNEPLLNWLVAIISLSFIFQPLGVVGHVFNARVLSKYPSLVSVFVAILIPALKLFVIWTNKGILYFAGIVAIEAFVISALYVLIYQRIIGGELSKLTVSWSTFKQLIHDSWPLMLVGVTGYLYARIDQVMIQHFIDSTSVGLYEAAVRITEPLGFFPGVIIGSLFPAIINAKRDSIEEYKKRFRSLAILCMGISITLATLIYIAAPYLISGLYGTEYSESITILRIYIWSNVGIVATLLMYNFFIAENKTKLQLIYTTIGAIINIILNYILIPLYGVSGAAYATLITVTSIVCVFLLTKRLLT